MLPQCLEHRPIRSNTLPGAFEIIPDGNKGFRVQGDSPELFPLADNINARSCRAGYAHRQLFIGGRICNCGPRPVGFYGRNAVFYCRGG
jgi:hypothetical protein